MLRRLFTLASAVSLLVCLATIAAWWRSYRDYDTLEYSRLWQANSPDNDPPSDKYLGIRFDSSKGEWSLERHFVWSDYAEPAWTHFAGPPTDFAVTRHGFYHESERLGGELVQCPWWAVVFTASGAFLIFALLAWRRQACLGRCVNCGYDLTGNTSGICPECGAAVVRSAPAGSRRA